MSRSAPALVLAILVLAGASAHAGTDASFLLRAELKDLPAYFPGYLGTGYVGTLTAPRGTESTPTYVIAFMDYTTADISRPAQVPAWNEMDFSSRQGAGLSWLTRARLDERHFADYRQTLDLQEATLTTHYRYVDGARATDVEGATLLRAGL